MPSEVELRRDSAGAGDARVTSSTGGEKGTKPETYDDMYMPALQELAKVYAMGAEKYERGNYRKGYPAILSISALMRHLVAWQAGEDLDPESGLSHLAHASWHTFCLQMILNDHPEFDDRQVSDYQQEENMLDAVKRSIVSDPNYRYPGVFAPAPPPAGLEPDPNELPSIFTRESDPDRWEQAYGLPDPHA